MRSPHKYILCIYMSLLVLCISRILYLVCACVFSYTVNVFMPDIQQKNIVFIQIAILFHFIITFYLNILL